MAAPCVPVVIVDGGWCRIREIEGFADGGEGLAGRAACSFSSSRSRRDSGGEMYPGREGALAAGGPRMSRQAERSSVEAGRQVESR
jgi:hypothetical protein